MQSNVWPRSLPRKYKHAKVGSIWKWWRSATWGSFASRHRLRHTHTHTHTHTHNSHIMKSSRQFTLHVTPQTKLLCLSIVMLNCLTEMNKLVVHTNTHTHTHTQRGWVIALTNVARALTQWGRMSCLSAIVELSVDSCHVRLGDNNSVFIAEHAGKLRCYLIRPRVLS